MWGPRLTSSQIPTPPVWTHWACHQMQMTPSLHAHPLPLHSASDIVFPSFWEPVLISIPQTPTVQQVQNWNAYHFSNLILPVFAPVGSLCQQYQGAHHNMPPPKGDSPTRSPANELTGITQTEGFHITPHSDRTTEVVTKAKSNRCMGFPCDLGPGWLAFF